MNNSGQVMMNMKLKKGTLLIQTILREIVKKLLITSLICLAATISKAQDLPEPWIAYPSASNTVYGVYHFRKTFSLQETDKPMVIHVSADNRYKLYVNGQRVAYGPAKGDLQTYKYDVIDIAPYLTEGENILAAEVFNMGENKPMAFLSAQTAFLLRAENPDFSEINTSSQWKVMKNEAYDPITYPELFKVRWFYGYYACGPGDEVFAEKYPWGWNQKEYNDSSWKSAEVLEFDRSPWNLVPRNIAMMDSFTEKPVSIRRVKGMDMTPGPVASALPLTIPANTEAEILLDFERFTMGYPKLLVEKGRGATIQVNYAEALYEDINIKGHRDSVGNLTMYGVFDIFHTDGGTRTYEPLWKRAFRYVQLQVKTAAEPLRITDYYNEFSGYPYDEPAEFVTNDDVLNELFITGFQTFRMCSGETYYDTPFYEQLSYGGDNRPIAAISMYNSTDDRLFREVMRMYPQSENTETHLFKSAYPSRFDFDMGTWSLAWIQSLCDYYEIRGDTAFVSQFTEDIEGVLNYYRLHMDESTNLLGPIWNENFVDWSIIKGSVPGISRRAEKPIVNSVLLSLYYAHTLDCAQKIYEINGEAEKAAGWHNLSEKIKQAAYKLAWDEEAGLFRDFPKEETFSQHTNIFAILTDALPEEKQEALLMTILNSDRFKEYASSYFSFFLYRAMEKTGREDLFLENLGFYKTFLDRGHTTFGETGFASHDRSDCHAWSAHPNYFLLNFTAGIKPASTGFEQVRIAPALGDIQSLNASMPHPSGRISVEYRKRSKKMDVVVELPPGMNGTWEWEGETRVLQPGQNSFKVNL